jgi:outer membrane receptor protein involved in Fe transport
MQRLISLLFIIAFLFANTLFAQSVTGKITQPDGTPLAGANVLVKDIKMGSTTDADGNFTVNLPQAGTYQVEFSFVGFEKIQQKITVLEGETNLGTIALKIETVFLNDGVTVTAQRAERRQFDVPEAVTIVTRQHIIENGARTAPEALLGATGVWVQKTNHGSGSPFVRGLTGNQALLLLDGIRLNNSTYRYGPNQYFVLVNPFNMDQIEVVRGTGSVLYGGDALGGAIQVLSRTPEFSQDKTRFGGAAFARYLSGDMEKTGRGEVQLSGKKVAFLAGFDYKDYGDLIAGDSIGKQAPSAYTEAAGDFKGLFQIGTKGLFTIAYNGVFQQDVGRYDQVKQRGFEFWQFNPQNRQMGYARLQFQNESRWLRQWNLTASWQNLLEGREFRRNNSKTQTEEEDAVNTLGFIAEVHSQPADNWQIVSGIEYYNDVVDSKAQDRNIETNALTPKRGLYPEDSQVGNAAVFTSHTLTFNRLSVNAGARFNYFSLQIKDRTFGDTEINPTALVGNVSARYGLNSQNAITASVNTGFRAPNVNDISTFGSFDFGIETPSAGLEPERTLTYELGYKLKTNFWAGNLSVYRTNLTNLIDRVKSTYNGQAQFNGQDVYKKENVAESFLEGIEFDSDFRLTSYLSLFTSLVYTYGQNTSRSEPMRRIPPLNGRVALTYRHSGWFGQAEWWYAARQDRLAAGDKSDHRINIFPGGTPGWNVFNLKAGYRFNKLDLNAGLQNILNEDYRIHGSGVDGVGRSVWVSGMLRF